MTTSAAAPSQLSIFGLLHPLCPFAICSFESCVTSWLSLSSHSPTYSCYNQKDNCKILCLKAEKWGLAGWDHGLFFSIPMDSASESSFQTLRAADGFCSLLSPLVYGNVFLLTELAHSFSRTNCSTLRQELAVF